MSTGVEDKNIVASKIIDSMNQIKPPFNVNRLALSAGIEAIKDKEWTKKAIKHNGTTIIDFSYVNGQLVIIFIEIGNL